MKAPRRPRVFPGVQVAAALDYIATQLRTMDQHGGAPALTLARCQQLLGDVLRALPVVAAEPDGDKRSLSPLSAADPKT